MASKKNRRDGGRSLTVRRSPRIRARLAAAGARACLLALLAARARARFAAVGPFSPASVPSRLRNQRLLPGTPCRWLWTWPRSRCRAQALAGGPPCSARPWLLGGNPPRRRAAPVVVPLRGRLFHRTGPRNGDPPHCSRLPPHTRLKVGPAALAALRSAALRLARLDFAHYVNRSSLAFRCRLGASAGPQFPRGASSPLGLAVLGGRRSPRARGDLKNNALRDATQSRCRSAATV
ncbi:hypothetical protein ES703_51941 [subsurface metagenome]